MRVAVLSDIHANLRALEAVLARVAAVDAIWHLGDIVGYGPDPDAVVARLDQLGAVGVRGNHDLAAIGDDVILDFNADARAAMEWTRATITPATLAWLAALPERRSVEGFSLVHGSPRDPTWEYILTEGAAAANIELLATTHGFFGHTHLPIAYLQAAGSRSAATIATVEPAAGSSLVLDRRRGLLNPGSVGQPRDGDRRASAIVLDLESQQVTWIRTEYDIAATQRAMQAAKLPARGIQRLSAGI